MKNGWEFYKDLDGSEVKHAPKTLIENVFTAETENVNLQELLDQKLDNINGIITTAHIVDGAIDNAKIALAAIEDAHIANAEISTAKIRDLTAEVLRAVTANINEVTAGTVQSNELYSELIKAVSAEIRHVTAGDVETNTLYAQIIGAVCADLEKIAAGEIKTRVIEAVMADIDSMTAGELYAALINAVRADIDLMTAGQLHAALAQVSKAEVRDAAIDFAQVQDLAAGNAIITKGVGGKLYIANLAVTEGNMVSLTTGELIVKGSDGKFYAIKVDNEGNIITEEKQVTGDNVADNTIGGEKIIENSITATQLNVQQIFADDALLGKVTAKNIDTASLFASDAFIGELKTHLIESEYLSVVIGQSEEMFKNMNMFFDFTNDALRIHKEGSEFSVAISDEKMGFFQNAQEIVYISNSQAHVPKLTVEETLVVGQHRFIVDGGGILSLVYTQ